MSIAVLSTALSLLWPSFLRSDAMNRLAAAMNARGASQPAAGTSANSSASQPAACTKGQELIDAVKTLGFWPKETRPTGDEGTEEYKLTMKARDLAEKIRRHRHRFTSAERIELDELQRTSVHPRDRAMSAQLLQEAQEPPNPGQRCF